MNVLEWIVVIVFGIIIAEIVYVLILKEDRKSIREYWAGMKIVALIVSALLIFAVIGLFWWIRWYSLIALPIALYFYLNYLVAKRYMPKIRKVKK